MTSDVIIPLLQRLVRSVEMAHHLPSDSYSAGERRKAVSALFHECLGRYPSQVELDMIDNGSRKHKEN